MNQAATNTTTSEREYLSFQLGDEQYAVEILQVQEIRGWQPVTTIPNSPEYFCGVLNLRGAIIPIVDLRLRFGMPFLDYSKTTVVVVLKLKEANKTIGLVVDAVSDTHLVDQTMVQPVPEMGEMIDTNFFEGLVDIDGQMVMLINIDYLLDSETV